MIKKLRPLFGLFIVGCLGSGCIAPGSSGPEPREDYTYFTGGPWRPPGGDDSYSRDCRRSGRDGTGSRDCPSAGRR